MQIKSMCMSACERVYEIESERERAVKDLSGIGQ